MGHPRIVKIEARPGYELAAWFANGERRVYDVTAAMEKWPDFLSLKEIPGLYGLARIEAGGYGVSWNEFIDLGSEEVWFRGRPF